jgi:ABC-type transport system involved in multi-copper enzyme maturation permease subunit
MLPLLRSEVFRLRRRWMTTVLLLVVVLGVAAVYIILWLVYINASPVEQLDQADELSVRAVPDIGMDVVNFLGSIVTVILAASIIGTEFGWGTIRALLPRARSRIELITAKLITLALFDVLIVLAGFVTATIFSSVIANVEGLDTSLSSEFWGDAIQSIAINLFVLLPYSALAFFVAVLTRSNAAGIAIGLAILLAEGIIVAILGALSDALDWIGDLLFTNNMTAILNENNPGGRGSTSDLPGTGQAIFVLVVWIVLLVGGSFWFFQRRDVTSG